MASTGCLAMSWRTAWSASRLLWISLIIAFTPGFSPGAAAAPKYRPASVPLAVKRLPCAKGRLFRSVLVVWKRCQGRGAAVAPRSGSRSAPAPRPAGAKLELDRTSGRRMQRPGQGLGGHRHGGRPGVRGHDTQDKQDVGGTPGQDEQVEDLVRP